MPVPTKNASSGAVGVLELNSEPRAGDCEPYTFAESPRTSSSASAGTDWTEAKRGFQSFLAEACELCEEAPRGGVGCCFGSPSLSSMKKAIGGTWLAKANAHLRQNALRVEVCTVVRRLTPRPPFLTNKLSQVSPAGKPAQMHLGLRFFRIGEDDLNSDESFEWAPPPPLRAPIFAPAFMPHSYKTRTN